MVRGAANEPPCSETRAPDRLLRQVHAGAQTAIAEMFPASTSPPWPRATSRAIVSPSPTPPVDGLRDGSSRTNGRKTRSRSIARDAGTVIVDNNVDPVVDAAAVSQTWLP